MIPKVQSLSMTVLAFMTSLRMSLPGARFNIWHYVYLSDLNIFYCMIILQKDFAQVLKNLELVPNPFAE